MLDLIHQHNPFPLHHHLAYGLTIGFHLCTMLPPTTERQDNSNSRALYLFPKIAPFLCRSLYVSSNSHKKRALWNNNECLFERAGRPDG